MRFLAAACFAAAAFAVPVPWLDRPGTAALGLAFMALSVGSRSRGRGPTLAELLKAGETP